MAGTAAKLINPTSCRRTFWQYTLMLLMVVNYLLDHDPRHVAYTKAQQKMAAAAASSSFSSLRDYGYSPPPSPELRRAHQRAPPPPPPKDYPRPGPRPDAKTRWPYPRATGSHYHAQAHAARTGGHAQHSAMRPPDGAQRRDAWMKMRVVTRTPLDARKRAERGGKNVRWGFKDVLEYELDDHEREMKKGCDGLGPWYGVRDV